MKNVKKLVSLIVILILAVAMAFAMTSCKKNKNKNHEHDYVASVTQATCTQKGYTTYTCECGESYVGDEVSPAHSCTSYEAKAPTCTESGWEAYEKCSKCDYTTYKAVPATGHRYDETITRYPTTTTVGIVSIVCADCGDTTYKELDTVAFALPTVAEFLKKMVGDNSYTLNVEDVDLIVLNELDTDGAVSGTKSHLALDLAKLLIDGKGEDLYAQIVLNVGVASYDSVATNAQPSFENKLALSVIVNGDNVYLTLDENNEVSADNFSLSEKFYGALANYLGITYDQLVEIIYVAGQLEEYIPIINKVIDTVSAVEVISDVDLTVPSVVLGDDVITVQDNDYILDLSALAEALKSAQGKTVADLIDDKYGAGTTDSIKDFLISMPTTKLRDVADYVITLSEESGIDVDQIYAGINLLIYSAYGIEFDIESEIVARYDMTVAEVVADLAFGGEATDDEISDAAAELSKEIEALVSTVTSYTLDQWFNLYEFGDPDYTVDGEVFSITERLVEFVEMLGASVKAEVYFDENDKLESAEFEIDGIELNCQVAGDKINAELYLEYELITLESDGINVNVVVYDGLEKTSPVKLTAKLNNTINGNSDEYIFEISDDERSVVYGKLLLVDGEFYFVDFKIKDVAYGYENFYDSATDDGSFTESEEEYYPVNITVVKNQDGSYSGSMVVNRVDYDYEKDYIGTVYFEKQVATVEEVFKHHFEILYSESMSFLKLTTYVDEVLMHKIVAELENGDGVKSYLYVEVDGEKYTVTFNNSDSSIGAELVYNNNTLFSASVGANEDKVSSIDFIFSILYGDYVEGYEDGLKAFQIIDFSYVGGEGDDFEIKLVISGLENNYEHSSHYDEYGNYMYEYEETWKSYEQFADIVIKNTETDGKHEAIIDANVYGDEFDVEIAYDVNNVSVSYVNNEYEFFSASVKAEENKLASLEIDINQMFEEGFCYGSNKKSFENWIYFSYVAGEGEDFDAKLSISDNKHFTQQVEIEYEPDLWYTSDLCWREHLMLADIELNRTETEGGVEYNLTVKSEGSEDTGVKLFDIVDFNCVIREDNSFETKLLLNSIEYDRGYQIEFDGDTHCITLTSSITNDTVADIELGKTAGKDEYHLNVKAEDEELDASFHYDIGEAELSVYWSGNELIYLDIKGDSENDKLTYVELDYNFLYGGEVVGYEGEENLFDILDLSYTLGENDEIDVRFALGIMHYYIDCNEGYDENGNYYHTHSHRTEYEVFADASFGMNKTDGKDTYELNVKADGDELDAELTYDHDEATLTITANGDKILFADVKAEDNKLAGIVLDVNALHRGDVEGYEEYENLFDIVDLTYADANGDISVAVLINGIRQYRIWNLGYDEITGEYYDYYEYVRRYEKLADISFGKTEVEGKDKYDITVKGEDDEVNVELICDSAEAAISVTFNENNIVLGNVKMDGEKLASIMLDVNKLYYGEVEGYEGEENLFDIIDFTYSDVDGKIDVTLVKNEVVSELNYFEKYDEIDDMYYGYYEFVTKYVNTVDFAATYDGGIAVTIFDNKIILAIDEIADGEKLGLTVLDGEDTLLDLEFTFASVIDNEGMNVTSLAITGKMNGQKVNLSFALNDGYLELVFAVGNDKRFTVKGSNAGDHHEFLYEIRNGNDNTKVGFNVSADADSFALEYDLKGIEKFIYSTTDYEFIGYDDYGYPIYKETHMSEKRVLDASGKIEISVE